MTQNEPLKNLLDLISHFVLMLECQLAEVVSNMQTTVQELMNGVRNVTEHAEAKIERANQIIHGHEAANGGLPVAPPVEPEASCTPIRSSALLDLETAKAGHRLRAQIEQIKSSNEHLLATMMDLMGVLSSEDVLRQNLEHVAISAGYLSNELKDLISRHPQSFTAKEIQEVAERLKRNTFASYSSEEEKEIFNRVYRAD